jgi:hypothetical protein
MYLLSQEPDERSGSRSVAASRTPAGSAPAGLEALLARIASDAAAHMTSGPASEEELARLEAAIGHALAPPHRAFLARLGSGIYYERHEMFGPGRAMIHDIELVPPLTQVCQGLPAGVIPIHRMDVVIHFMDLRLGPPAPVFSLMSAERYADFETFLREVVVPREAATGAGSL